MREDNATIGMTAGAIILNSSLAGHVSGANAVEEQIVKTLAISKQFTAMSILLLAQRGQLSLEDATRAESSRDSQCTPAACGVCASIG